MSNEGVALSSILAHHARRSPSRAALILGDVVVTYEALDARANRRARMLATHGVGLGDFVTVALPNGLEFYVEDRGGLGYGELYNQAMAFIGALNSTPGFDPMATFTSYQSNVPQLDASVDRTKVKELGLALTDVFNTLQVYLGSAYVNDFNLFGRTYQVYAQADARHRSSVEDIEGLKVRNARGDAVPDAEVAVRAANGATMWARTDAGGRAWLHPRAFDAGNSAVYEITARKNGRQATGFLRRGQKSAVELTLDAGDDTHSNAWGPGLALSAADGTTVHFIIRPNQQVYETTAGLAGKFDRAKPVRLRASLRDGTVVMEASQDAGTFDAIATLSFAKAPVTLRIE